MKKAGDDEPRAAKATSGEFEPYSKRKIDPARFKPDLSPKQLAAIFTKPGAIDVQVVYFLPIDTLGVTKMAGLGRTNLTLIVPTIVQADAATPYAGFDRGATPSRNPAVSMHFTPGAYGITGAWSYVMAFSIEVPGSSNFNLSAYAGSGTVSNTGPKVLSGQTSISLVFHNIPASQTIWGALTQTGGGGWNFYSARVRYPSLVLSP